MLGWVMCTQISTLFIYMKEAKNFKSGQFFRKLRSSMIAAGIFDQFFLFSPFI